jgi:hypothetical protein
MTMAALKETQSPTSSHDAGELKVRVDLVAFASQFTRLGRSGRQFLGLCPLHAERCASFYVHPDKQVFHCFGCGAGGDVFAFVMRVNDCDFRRAMEIVAEFSAGVARASEPRSGSRLGASEGAKPLSPPKAGGRHSQAGPDARSRILDSINVTDRRLHAIAATNLAASAALTTACEPDRAERSKALLLEKPG